MKFEEEVRVMSMLPDKMLIGRRSWRANSLQLDLGKNAGSVRYKNRHVHGPIGSCDGEDSENMSESVRAVIEDADVDQVLKTMDFSAFSASSSKRNQLRELIWKRRDIFKGLGQIVGVQHKIPLKADVKPVCEPLSRRSPKEEVGEQAAMEKLVRMGVLEAAVSPWAANNVFVQKKTAGLG